MIKNRRILLLALTIIIVFVIIFLFIPKKSQRQTISTPTPSTIIDIKDTETVKISPISSTSGFEGNQIFGINRKNGNLISFKDNKESVIYSGQVKDYDVKANIVVIIDDKKPSEIVVLNIETKSQRTINLLELAPIISVALSDDLQKIYFLSGFSISTKISDINSVLTDGIDQKKLGETPAQNMKYLRNNILLLLEDAHAVDKGSIHFFDTEKGSVVLTKIADSFHVSPDKNSVLLQTSDRIEVVNSTTFHSQSKSTQLSSRSLWKDNNTVVLFRNDSQGVNYAKLNLNPFELSPFKLFIQNSAMQTAFGFIGNSLFWQDYDENIYTTTLEP